MRNVDVLLIFDLCKLITAFNYLVISPLFGYSHTNFMGTIADTLTNAGHNVTVLMPIMDPEMEYRTGLITTKNVIKILPDNRTAAMFMQKSKFMTKMWNLEPSAFGMMELGTYITRCFTYQCEKVFNDDQVMNELRQQYFDVGIAEPFDICGFGIFELLNVKATIASSSCIDVEPVSRIIGIPSAASYVPGMMSTKGDVMGILERLKNVIEILLSAIFFEQLFSMEILAFRTKYGNDFKSYEELLSQVSYVFTNSNPYLDYPRPSIHKSVDIGGITVSIVTKDKLPKDYDLILSERKTNVIVSFGSVIKSCYMPENYKKSLCEVFKAMPNTTFIWKYENEDTNNMFSYLSNVHLRDWLPQRALLADPRISSFVTHGGLGSTTEIAYMGIPTIPLFGDQKRNANMLAKHGGAIVLEKHDLANPDKLIEAIQTILTENSYTINARLLGDLLVHQPISPEQLMTKHAEFAARFGRVPNLDPYGRHLSTIQYYLIDVICVLITVTLIVLYLCYRILKLLAKIRVFKRKHE